MYVENSDDHVPEITVADSSLEAATSGSCSDYVSVYRGVLQMMFLTFVQRRSVCCPQVSERLWKSLGSAEVSAESFNERNVKYLVQGNTTFVKRIHQKQKLRVESEEESRKHSFVLQETTKRRK